MAPRLRVGLDAHMIGGRETGNETYVIGLAGGLRDLDDDIEVLLYHAPGARPSGGSHIEPRRLISASPWIRLGMELPVRSWRDHIDVLHTTYTAPVLSRCPVVVTVHDICFATNPEWFSARDIRVLSRVVPWSVRRAARVITVSEVCRRQIMERYGLPDDRVVCVHNAPGPAAQAMDAADARVELSALGFEPSRPYVLAVGNLQPRKNLVRLVRAFGMAVSQGMDADLVIVGAEHYRASEVLAAAEGAHGRIRFTGYVTDRQLAAFYTHATLFCLPSLFEGFGIPAVEAMAHGVAVACSDAGALPEVCGDAALYFDPLDVGSIARVIARALADQSLREDLAARGRSRANSFSWEQSARETVAVYDAVTGGRATPRPAPR